MAVQKHKVTRSRRGMRRSHDGYYRGRKVIDTEVEIDEDDE